jgi:hypothetical protein
MRVSALQFFLFAKKITVVISVHRGVGLSLFRGLFCAGAWNNTGTWRIVFAIRWYSEERTPRGCCTKAHESQINKAFLAVNKST